MKADSVNTHTHTLAHRGLIRKYESSRGVKRTEIEYRRLAAFKSAKHVYFREKPVFQSTVCQVRALNCPALVRFTFHKALR